MTVVTARICCKIEINQSYITSTFLTRRERKLLFVRPFGDVREEYSLKNEQTTETIIEGESKKSRKRDVSKQDQNMLGEESRQSRMSDTSKRDQNVLEQGSFLQLLVKLSLPAMVVILIMLLYNLADTFFIGQTGDPNKIAAISLSMPLFSLFSGISTLFGNGGCTSISIALGAGEEKKVRQISTFCTLGCLVVGLVGFLLVFFRTEALARLLGADAATIDYTVTYLRVFSFACPLLLFANSYGSILRADGGAALAMVANLVGTLVNILLDALFILGFHWDVFGAALATVIGNAISALFVIWLLLNKKKVFLPGRKDLILRKEIVIPVLTLGLPMTCSTLLGSISGTFGNRLMIAHGSTFLAAQSVASKIGMLITMLLMGVTMGMQPAISYNFGRKNYGRMKEIFGKLVAFSMILGLALTGLIFVTKDALIAAFIDNADVIRYGRTFVLASVMIGPIYGIYQTCQTFLQATGKVNYAIFTSLLDKGLIYLPVLFAMNQMFGAYGIAFSHAVTMVLTIFAVGFLTMRWGKELKMRK